MSWAKWIIGVAAFVIAILGVKTYFDVQNKINATIDKELEAARNETKTVIKQFMSEKNVALKNLQMEINRASTLISKKTAQASARIDEIVGGLPSFIVSPSITGLTRLIYDAENKDQLPGKLVRTEGDAPSSDKIVNEVYENIGITYRFFKDVFDLQITPEDGKITGTVHYSSMYNNAFWSGEQLVLGDGDGVLFSKLSGLDLFAGELSYRLIQKKSKLPYHGEQGALITHFRDVFSVMVMQWHKRQKARSASWLIGSDTFSSKVNGIALRSMKAPGTAYDDSMLGKDPQPSHMKDFVNIELDNGGVHVNCGIPNHAFFLAAVEIGGYSWERIGIIWLKSLELVTPTTDFKDFAAITLETTKKLYGENSDEARAVVKGWSEVGINI